MSTKIEIFKPINHSKVMIQSVLDGNIGHIMNCFTWVNSPQGGSYWSDVHRGNVPLSEENLSYLRWLIKHKENPPPSPVNVYVDYRDFDR